MTTHPRARIAGTATVAPSPAARMAYGLPDASPIGVVVQLDGTTILVAEDGSATLILPGGWPRPGCAHATARRQRLLAEAARRGA